MSACPEELERFGQVAAREVGVRHQRTVVLQHQQIVALERSRQRVRAAQDAQVALRPCASPAGMVAFCEVDVAFRLLVEEDAGLVRA